MCLKESCEETHTVLYHSYLNTLSCHFIRYTSTIFTDVIVKDGVLVDYIILYFFYFFKHDVYNEYVNN